MGSAERPPRIVFHLTGFSEFAGVDENPTESIIRELPSFVRSYPLPPNVHIASYEVLNVSGEATREYITNLCKHVSEARSASSAAAKEVHVAVHFGVAVTQRGFALERQATNDATFRFPDQRGWQPVKERIFSCYENVSYPLQTELPLDSMLPLVSESCLGDLVSISLNPGTFVCNYIYFWSLHAFQRASEWNYSLFVHVPSLERASPEKQIHFAYHVIRTIAETMQ